MSWTTLSDIATIQGWYKADAITGLADGDAVSTWIDSSGLSRDLTGTLTARPLYKTSIINSLPVVRFDGSNDILSSASWTLGTAGLSTACVFRLASLKDYNSFVAIHDAATPSYPSNKYRQVFVYNVGDVLHGQTAVATHTFNRNVTGIAATTPSILAESYSASYTDAKLNGYGKPTSSCMTPASTTGTAYTHVGYVGLAGSYLNGDIAELVIWRETSLRESVWIEGYLAHKYAITLDSGHLFKEVAPNSAPATYNAAGGGLLLPRSMNGGFGD